MVKSVDHFPDKVREEIVNMIDGLDVFRLLALRDFLQSWTRPARRSVESSSKALVKGPAIASAANPSDSAIEVEAKLNPPKKARTRPAAKSKRRDETLRELHAEGLNTAEIARRTGVKWSTVSTRLRKLGITAVRGKQGHPRSVSDEVLIALQQEGLTRRQIAERTRLRDAWVRKRLQRLGLKAAPARRDRSANGTVRCPDEQPRKTRSGGYFVRCSDEKFKALVERGLSDFDIASDLEIGRKAVAARRRKLGLPPASHYRPQQETPAPLEPIVRDDGVKVYPPQPRTQSCISADMFAANVTEFFLPVLSRQIPAKKPPDSRSSFAESLYYTKDEYRRYRRMRASAITDEQYRELHKQGFNNVQISQRLGVSYQVARNTRRRIGLLAIPVQRRKFTDAQLQDLHAAGWNDAGIARLLNVYVSTVYHRRRCTGSCFKRDAPDGGTPPADKI